MVEQPFIQGFPVSQEEINNFLVYMGFKLQDSRNWTYYTPEIYLSDMHDENSGSALTFLYARHKNLAIFI